MDYETIVGETCSLKIAITVGEAIADRVRNIFHRHAGFWECNPNGFNLVLDISYERNKILHEGLEAEVLICTKAFK